MKVRLEKLQQDALAALQNAADEKSLQDVRVRFLGKKGELTEVMKGMRDLAPEERPAVGGMINKVNYMVRVEGE